MQIQQSFNQLPLRGLQQNRPTPPTPEPPTEPEDSHTRGENLDRTLAIGGLAATLGAVVFAGAQGSAWGAVLGAGVAGVTGMVSGLPMAMTSKGTGNQIGNYVISSVTTLTLGVAAGAFMGAQGHGLLAAAGVGAGAALLGRVGAELF